MKCTIISVVLFSVLALFLSCMQHKRVAQSSRIQYLALGDSYTIGQGVPTSSNWPNQLSERLQKTGHGTVQTEIIARTGWTTGQLLKALPQKKRDSYDLVSLSIGVNNQYRGQPFRAFEIEFEELLQQAISLAGSKERVFVVSIPDYGVTPFGKRNSERIAMEIDKYNAHQQKRCREEGVLFVDVTEISRELGSGKEALAKDKLHPSGEQYKLWVEEMFLEVVGLVE